MSAFAKCLLLFILNWLDAQLTIVWVRAGVATEGNHLMALLLDAGYHPFLWTKVAVGALVAFTLYRFAGMSIARRGLNFALGLYLSLMLLHAATGATALGYRPPDAFIALISRLPESVLGLFS
jgi:hypothetical protein